MQNLAINTWFILNTRETRVQIEIATDKMHYLIFSLQYYTTEMPVDDIQACTNPFYLFKITAWIC